MPHKPNMKYLEVTIQNDSGTNKFTVSQRMQHKEGFFVSYVLVEQSGFDEPEDAEKAAIAYIHEYMKKVDEMIKNDAFIDYMLETRTKSPHRWCDSDPPNISTTPITGLD